jgi:hypothetical protein
VSTSSLLVDTENWVAGVLDSCGSYRMWCGGGGRWSWRVSIVTNAVTAARFERVTGVRVVRIGRRQWALRGEELIPLLAISLPRMFCLREEASAVYRFLITRPGNTGLKRMRGKMSEAVEGYRRRMARRAAETRVARADGGIS